MKRKKKTNLTTAEKHLCSEKYFIEMPEIPILCLGRTETPAGATEWVNQTELWCPAPTHHGTLAQSDPQRKGNQDLYPSSLSSRSQFLHCETCGSFVQALSELSLCEPSACALACVAIQSADPGSLPAQTIPEAGMRCSHRFVLNSHPRTETKCFKLSGLFCGAACAGSTGWFAVQNDFNPNMETKLKKLL